MDELRQDPVEVQEPQRIVIQHTRPAWTREERAGFGFVIGAGFLALVLGIFYMLHHVSSPFFVEYTGPRFQTDAEKQAELLASQRAKDTDTDGLSDYDELYVYKTSPYLSDTDGDKISDATEIQAGTDPSCPTGNDCNTTLSNPDGVSRNAVAGSVGDAPTPPTTGTTSASSSADVQSALSAMSPTQIRQLLVQAGASQSQVDALSDSEVLSLYQSVLADVQAKQQDASTSGTTTTTP